MNSRQTDRITQDLKESFDRIQADDALKARTKAFVARKTSGYRHSAAAPYRRIAAVFACFVLLLLAGGGYSSYFTQTSTISVDVNPSIELGINRYDRVISVHSFNADKTVLIAAKDIRFLDYRDALDVLFAADSMAAYFTQDYLIDITVFGPNEDKSSEILENLAGSTSHYDNVHCSSGNSRDVEAAHAHGMSCGKYRAYLELYAIDPSVTAEDVQDLTMRQIRDLINELSGEAASTQDSSSGTNQDSEHKSSESDSTDSDRLKNSAGDDNESKNGNEHCHDSNHGH